MQSTFTKLAVSSVSRYCARERKQILFSEADHYSFMHYDKSYKLLSSVSGATPGNGVKVLIVI